jgi:cation diffusion facilitator family transporter
LALAGFKTAAALMANSVSLLASALDSLTDFLASALNLFSLRLSQHPPDQAHPYGRGKAEDLAGLAQGLFIAVGGLGLLVESLRRLWGGSAMRPGLFGMAVMLISALLSLWHSRELSRAQATNSSTVLRTESAHFAADVLANLGVLVALWVSWAGGSPLWDVGVSIAITLAILRQALGVIQSAVLEVLDRGLPCEILTEIEGMIRGHHPLIAGFHDLRTRKAGSRLFIDFHVEIKDIQDFEQAHEIAETLIERIRQRIPEADVTIHCDPLGGR